MHLFSIEVVSFPNKLYKLNYFFCVLLAPAWFVTSTIPFYFSVPFQRFALKRIFASRNLWWQIVVEVLHT